MDYCFKLVMHAVSEEALFRGFLWGYLRLFGLHPVWTWLVIALSFVIGHRYYFGRYAYFSLCILPAGALSLGFIAWKTRSNCLKYWPSCSIECFWNQLCIQFRFTEVMA